MKFFRPRAGVFAVLVALLILGVGAAATIGFTTTDDADADAATPIDLVPDRPRRDLPKVLDGTALDAARVGDWIVVAGDFTRLKLQDGTLIDQTAVFAYDLDTGALNPNFRPVLTKSSGSASVLAVEPAADGIHVYLGGKFGQVDGTDQARLTRISVATGVVDTGFVAHTNGPVRDIVRTGDRLFVGGEFTSVNGLQRRRLAEVHALSGDVAGGFRFDITESTREIAGDPYGPKYLGITPDNTLVVAHRGARVGGKLRTGVALINLSNNSLRAWRTSFWGSNMVTTVDAEVSPDGSLLVLGGDGGDFPYMGRDSAVAFSLTDKNSGAQQPVWIARNFDSTYAVGITDDAVYVGGHFCWVESELAPDPWPGDGEFSNNNSCFGLFPAARFAPGVVHRDQIAALDPETGHALLWDPGSDGLEGVQMIEVIDRGLLIGHDGTFFGRDGSSSRAWNVGRHAFLDTSAQGPDNSEFVDVPVVGLCDGRTPTITGTTRADVLTGTPGNDVILAGPGADVVNGGAGHDVICGGGGRDRLFGEQGNDSLFGGDGRDKLLGGDGNDRLWGQNNGDVLAGERGHDVLTGGKGKDRLNGGAGKDLLKGSPGPDTLQGGLSVDDLRGGIDSDTCAGRSLGADDNVGDVVTECEKP